MLSSNHRSKCRNSWRISRIGGSNNMESPAKLLSADFAVPTASETEKTISLPLDSRLKAVRSSLFTGTTGAAPIRLGIKRTDREGNNQVIPLNSGWTRMTNTRAPGISWFGDIPLVIGKADTKLELQAIIRNDTGTAGSGILEAILDPKIGGSGSISPPERAPFPKGGGIWVGRFSVAQIVAVPDPIGIKIQPVIGESMKIIAMTIGNDDYAAGRSLLARLKDAAGGTWHTLAAGSFDNVVIPGLGLAIHDEDTATASATIGQNSPDDLIVTSRNHLEVTGAALVNLETISLKIMAIIEWGVPTVTAIGASVVLTSTESKVV